jgi:4-carboxymuconolactone decarboxylase
LLEEAAVDVPEGIREDWTRYLAERYEEMWSRPGLSMQDRSIVTVAALATLHVPGQLRVHVRIALDHGVSRRTLCGVMMQVAGYAGIGIGAEGMRTLREVFDADAAGATEPTADEVTAGPGPRTQDRRSMGVQVLATLRPGQDPFAIRYTFAPDWRPWLHETAFGELWARTDLALVDRERVTMAVLVALGFHRELRAHFQIALNIGITAEEISEQLMHLAPYVGFPAVVGALRLADEVVRSE